jgi:hypothetical protein
MTGSDVDNSAGQDSESIGIAANWAANEWLDVYAGLEQASVDFSGGGSTEDLTTGTVGLKVSF